MSLAAAAPGSVVDAADATHAGEATTPSGVLDRGCLTDSSPATPSAGDDPTSVELVDGLGLLDELVRDVLLCPTSNVGSPPRWQTLLLDHPPTATTVEHWWHGLSDTPLAHALVAGAPLVIGNLAGVPFDVRVAANAITAADELVARETSYAESLRSGADGTLLAALDAEASFLRGVVSGTTLLAGYRPERGEIVQLIAPRVAEVRTTIIYTPGTYATESGMYDGSIQQVGEWLAARDPGIAVFVWLGTRFPGSAGAADPANAVNGLIEAADPATALAAGHSLATFQSGVLADPVLGSTRQIAIGHSWGLAATTAAEIAGAHFEQVHSLAGAYTAPGWTPQPGTIYRHWTYDDFVSVFQQFGLLSSTGGEIPTDESAFRSTTFATPGAPGAVAAAASGDMATSIFELTDRPTANHELIATEDPENRAALDAIRGTIG